MVGLPMTAWLALDAANECDVTISKWQLTVIAQFVG
jgi:hypothetical protein